MLSNLGRAHRVAVEQITGDRLDARLRQLRRVRRGRRSGRRRPRVCSGAAALPCAPGSVPSCRRRPAPECRRRDRQARKSIPVAASLRKSSSSAREVEASGRPAACRSGHHALSGCAGGDTRWRGAARIGRMAAEIHRRAATAKPGQSNDASVEPPLIGWRNRATPVVTCS